MLKKSQVVSRLDIASVRKGLLIILNVVLSSAAPGDHDQLFYNCLAVCTSIDQLSSISKKGRDSPAFNISCYGIVHLLVHVLHYRAVFYDERFDSLTEEGSCLRML
jgi:hypothetical protein